MKKHHKNQAFTLIELLLVFAIILLLSSIVLASVSVARVKANDAKIKEDLRQVKTALELYYSKFNSYPATASGNRALVKGASEAKLNPFLSFGTKIAQAVAHTNKLCRNFDIMASKLVSEKLIPTVPVHPYDDDANGICYKAYANQVTLVSFAPLAGATLPSGSGGESRSKRYGIILGQSDVSSLNTISQEMYSDNNGGDNTSPGYPSSLDTYSYSATDQIADEVYGMTTGYTSNSSTASLSGFIGGIISSFIPTFTTNPPAGSIIPPSGGLGGPIYNPGSQPVTCNTGNNWCSGAIPQAARESGASTYGPTNQIATPNYYYQRATAEDSSIYYLLSYCTYGDIIKSYWTVDPNLPGNSSAGGSGSCETNPYDPSYEQVTCNTGNNWCSGAIPQAARESGASTYGPSNQTDEPNYYYQRMTGQNFSVYYIRQICPTGTGLNEINMEDKTYIKYIWTVNPTLPGNSSAGGSGTCEPVNFFWSLYGPQPN